MRTRTSVAATLLLLAAAAIVHTLKDDPLPTQAVRFDPGDLEDGPLGDTPLFYYRGPMPFGWPKYMPFRGRHPLWPVGRAPRTRGGVRA